MNRSSQLEELTMPVVVVDLSIHKNQNGDSTQTSNCKNDACNTDIEDAKDQTQPEDRRVCEPHLSVSPVICGHVCDLILSDCTSGPEPHGLFPVPGIDSKRGKNDAAGECYNDPDNSFHISQPLLTLRFLKTKNPANQRLFMACRGVYVAERRFKNLSEACKAA